VLPGVLALLAAALLAPAASAADHDVTIAGAAFEPETVTVVVGDSITWSNDDGVSHSATADDGSFDSGTLAPGDTAAVVFGSTGSFAYHCEIHPTMTGYVVVETAATDGEGDQAGAAGTDPARVTQAPTDTEDIVPRDPGDATRALIAALLFLGVAMLVGTAIAQRRLRDHTGR
jgi:plastocyanin